MRSYPRARAAGETVREIVARILVENIADPRLDLVTVTGVDMSPDLGHANVFVTAHGDEERLAEVLVGLDSAKGRIRSLLGREMTTRLTPELHFRIDPSIEAASRITDAIREEYESGRLSDEPEAAHDDGYDV